MPDPLDPRSPEGPAINWQAGHRHPRRALGHALKLMMPHLVADVEAVARFREEARNALRLNRPGTVRVTGFGDRAGHKYVVME